MIQCKDHVMGLFMLDWPGRRAGSRRVTGRDMTQPAGEVPRVRSLEVFYVFAIKENTQNSRENTICFRLWSTERS